MVNALKYSKLRTIIHMFVQPIGTMTQYTHILPRLGIKHLQMGCVMIVITNKITAFKQVHKLSQIRLGVYTFVVCNNYI